MTEITDRTARLIAYVVAAVFALSAFDLLVYGLFYDPWVC